MAVVDLGELFLIVFDFAGFVCFAMTWVIGECLVIKSLIFKLQKTCESLFEQIKIVNTILK